MLLSALLAGIIGCQKNSDATADVLRTHPSIIGEVTAIVLPAIRVEENPADSSGSAKASVRVADGTHVLRRDGTVVGTAELRVGQRVKVWFTGPVAQSYPVQATARVIVIEQGEIVTVKERHEAELMAIPGVVGVGIGGRDGAEHIIVMVEKRTAEIERKVPDTLDGYPVLTEVTGPIIALPR